MSVLDATWHYQAMVRAREANSILLRAAREEVNRLQARASELAENETSALERMRAAMAAEVQS